MEETYDKYILETLTLPDELNVIGYFPTEKEIFDFCIEKGIGIVGLSKRTAMETLLYEQGITNAEIKSSFGKYLGLPAIYFIHKYNLTNEEMEKLADKNLIIIVAYYGQEPLYDAEFYYDSNKFISAWNILETSQ